MGVGGCETKTIGYTRRAVALTVFGQGFDQQWSLRGAILGWTRGSIGEPYRLR